MSAGRDGLEPFFDPRSVAVVGASQKPSKHGHRLVANLAAGDGTRAIYPVTQSDSGPILGYESFGSLRELPEPPDLVLISVPAQAVPGVIADAAATGAKAAIVFACGFAEAGDEGRELQDRMLEPARSAGLRIMGPNCMGVFNVEHQLRATYYTELPSTAGSVGFVSQSGAFAHVALTMLGQDGVGISKFASIGNMADVTHAELIRYLGADEETRAIAAFVEGAPNGEELLDAIADVSPHTPVVVLKGARTPTGQTAAMSHTASLAGEGRAWEALLHEAGALVAQDTEDLFDTAATLARCGEKLPKGDRLAIVTISGGPAVVAADACEGAGLRLPQLAPELADLEGVVPTFASLANPVDLTSMIAPEHYAPVVDAVAALPTVDAILAVNVGLDRVEFAEALVRVWERTDTPVVSYVVGRAIERCLGEAGIPNLPTVERAVRSLARLRERARALEADAGAGESPRYRFAAAAQKPGAMTEYEAKRLLSRYGVAVPREELAASAGEAIRAAARIGYPVALKLSSAEIVHKSDVGGVVLGIENDDALRDAWSLLDRRFGPAPRLVQEMVAADLELMVGARRDPTLGPILMVGLGGVAVELLGDVTFTRAPVTSRRALAAIERLRHQAILDGFRGAQPIDRGALAELLERLSAVFIANPEILEIDLNPVMASASRMVAADAYIGLRSA